MGQIRSLGSFVVLLGLAAIAYALGNTFQTILTIFSILVWIVVALLAAYMVLYRNMKFSLFKDKPRQNPEDLPGDEGFDEPVEMIFDEKDNDRRQ